MHPQAATRLAGQVLDWLIDHPARLAGFLEATGLDADGLRACLAQPETAAELDRALIDHLMADEALLREVCAGLGLPFEAPAAAQIALGGGPGPHWT